MSIIFLVSFVTNEFNIQFKFNIFKRTTLRIVFVCNDLSLRTNINQIIQFIIKNLSDFPFTTVHQSRCKACSVFFFLFESGPKKKKRFLFLSYSVYFRRRNEEKKNSYHNINNDIIGNTLVNQRRPFWKL